MATPKEQEKLEEENVNKLDFTKKEIDYILENANFTYEEERIFLMLTSKYGRATITSIALELPLSESTVKRRIKK